MPGYSGDQFFNLPSGVGFTDASDNTNRNNKFLFPGPTRKRLGKNGEMQTKLSVQRGFIRMLPQSAKGTALDKPLATKQCFFQFNPQNISRAASMRGDMMNPLLQDASQFSVPVPGNMNFNFEIFFDRSFEINNDTVEAQARAAFDALMGADSLGSPESIGVLHDLRTLDAIIGQGISSDMIQYILERGEIAASYQSTSVTTSEDSESTDTGFTWDAGKADTFLNKNVGNQAFLIPNPVRVVFSSLFMVDGFVKSVNVNFARFNENMVPVQAAIGISMEALYLGFARADTYLTYALEQATVNTNITSTDSPVSTIVDAAAAEATKALIGPLLSKFKIGPQELKTNNDWYTDTLDPWTMEERRALYNVASYQDDQYCDTSSDPTLPLFPTSSTDAILELYETFPMLCGSDSLEFVFGFSSLPKDGLTPSTAGVGDQIWYKWNTANSPIKSISYYWWVRGTRPALDIESEAGKTSIEVFNFSYTTETPATDSDSWDSIRQKRQISVPNQPSGGTTKNVGRRLQVGTKAAWISNCNQLLSGGSSRPIPGGIPLTKITAEAGVNVEVLDTSGNTIRLSGRSTKPLTLGTPLVFSFNLTMEETGD